MFDQEVQDIDRALQDWCRSEDEFRGFKQPLLSIRERPFDFNETRSLGRSPSQELRMSGVRLFVIVFRAQGAD